MIFRILRTSDPHDEFSLSSQPCKEAVRRDAVYTAGTYRADSAVWAVDVADLEGLMAFITKQGHCVISDAVCSMYNLLEIEIYDGYRE